MRNARLTRNAHFACFSRLARYGRYASNERIALNSRIVRNARSACFARLARYRPYARY